MQHGCHESTRDCRGQFTQTTFCGNGFAEMARSKAFQPSREYEDHKKRMQFLMARARAMMAQVRQQGVSDTRFSTVETTTGPDIGPGTYSAAHRQFDIAGKRSTRPSPAFVAKNPRDSKPRGTEASHFGPGHYGPPPHPLDLQRVKNAKHPGSATFASPPRNPAPKAGKEEAEEGEARLWPSQDQFAADRAAWAHIGGTLSRIGRSVVTGARSDAPDVMYDVRDPREMAVALSRRRAMAPLGGGKPQTSRRRGRRRGGEDGDEDDDAAPDAVPGPGYYAPYAAEEEARAERESPGTWAFRATGRVSPRPGIATDIWSDWAYHPRQDAEVSFAPCTPPGRASAPLSPPMCLCYSPELELGAYGQDFAHGHRPAHPQPAGAVRHRPPRPAAPPGRRLDAPEKVGGSPVPSPRKPGAVSE